MQSISGDPLDWSVDEVVNFLCHNPKTPWSNSTSNRPNAASLEASLREHYITGEVLLEDVEKETLRDDLGLKALGHRSSVMKAISYLRKRSAKFQSERLDQASLVSSSVPFPPQHILHTPSAHPSPVQPVQQSSPLPLVGPDTPLLNKPPTTAVIPDAPNVRDEFETMSVVVPDGSEAGFPASSDNTQSAYFRSREHTVIDEIGRKRRRLNLGTYVKSRNERPTPHQSSHSETENWYMGPDDLTSEQIFYSPDPEGGGQTFTLVSSRLPTAQCAFVNSSLKYFFQQSPIELTSGHGASQQAVVPYKNPPSKSGKDRFFTLKERMSDWPQLARQLKVSEGAKSSESLKPSDPFSYLLEKYPVEQTLEDALPLYGDSGSEGQFDDETWREMEEEQGDPIPPQRKTLGPAEIGSIMTNCITEFERAWRESHLPKEEYKARKLWIVARQSRSANQQIKSLSKDLSSLTVRLEKLKDEIRKNDYSGEGELRTQCQCLEHTVFNIQKQQWRITVLERNECPPKVAAPAKIQHAPKPIGEEESLDSESDFSVNGSLDDFIIDDIRPLKVLQNENIPASPESSSDGDDDIISVSGTRRRTGGRPLRVFASSSPSPSPSPPRHRPIYEKPDVIDLTMETSEPEDLMIKTPPLNPVAGTSNVPESTLPGIGSSISPPPSLNGNRVRVKIEHGYGLPDLDDMEGILSLDWGLIEERRDHGRLLTKLIAGLSEEERTAMAEQIPTYKFSKLKRFAQKALKSLSRGLKEVPGLQASESHLIMRTVTFYVSWLHCVRPDRAAIKKKRVETALEKLEDYNHRRFEVYYDELIERLERCQSWKGDSQPSNALELENDSDVASEPVKLGDTPHMKRKREVKESQSAKENQADARLRVEEQEKQRKKLEKRLESMGLRNNHPDRQPVSFKEPAIYLNSHIGQRIKPHQLSGIQFMWRELIEDRKQEGCLLAHTMGLGKTLQVISLLTTISEAANSPNPEVRKQIPEPLRQSKTLILCPASLIDNWHDEFLMWSPKHISSSVRRVSSTEDLETRLAEMSAWYEEGGVLLIGYHIFKTLILNNGTEKRGKQLLDSEHENVKRWLLEGPNIIVADEAHTMKNKKTAVSQATMQFRSRSRIALTGSPLANNLEDYYNMVKWIAEDFLGSLVQFKAHYIEPITDGLYEDSSHYERRKSLVKLQVLKQILEPKIHRADISVLAADLPPKVEFLLTVPLTELQKAAYDVYATHVLQGQTGEFVQNSKLWSWLSILGMCCNHPACFRDRLISRTQDAPKKDKSVKKSGDTGQTSPELDDESIINVGLPNLDSLVSEELELLAQAPDLMAIELSTRAVIALRIIEESIKAGDKILVFSRSIATLDYLQHILKVAGRRYSRLDGHTRVASRQAATKEFNEGNKNQVYLISTKAGGLGLNILGANRVIIFDFAFDPVWEEQAIGRAYRLGQRKPVFVYRFLAGGTFEDIVYHKASFKTQLARRVVDRKNPTREAKKKPGDYLFPAKPVPILDVSEYIGKDEHVLDKILIEDKDRGDDRLIRGIKLTETFQADENEKLTEDENRTVQEEIDDESLRRSDPDAYDKRIRERQAKELLLLQQQQYQQHYQAHPSAQFPVSVAHGVYHQLPRPAYNARPTPAMPVLGTFTTNRQSIQHTVSENAHNSGPPALAPDMIPQPLGETRPSGPQHTQSALLKAVNRLQTPSHRLESEPLKPNSPIVNVSRPESMSQQKPSSWGKSVPPQLDGSHHTSSADSDEDEEKAQARCRPQ
ncbi:P-loop containing nucleoside triphosphate hydrolase protein [Aspergillus unguis]